MVYRHADRNRNVYARKKHIIKKAEREAAALSPSRSDRWQANFLIKSLRSPIPITVCHGERQGCCREYSRFFMLYAVF